MRRKQPIALCVMLCLALALDGYVKLAAATVDQQPRLSPGDTSEIPEPAVISEKQLRHQGGETLPDDVRMDHTYPYWSKGTKTLFWVGIAAAVVGIVALFKKLRGSGSGPSPDTEAAAPSRTVEVSGTAFVVHPDGLMLTAKHLVFEATSITVSCNERPPVAARVRRASPDANIAVIEPVESLGTRSFLRLSGPALINENVFTVGYPDTEPIYEEGTVSALTGRDGNAFYLEVNYEVPMLRPGHSGGPLVDRESGAVIGVVVVDATEENFDAVRSEYGRRLFDAPGTQYESATDSGVIIQGVIASTCRVSASIPVQ